MAGRSRRTPQGGPRSPPLRSPRPGRARAHRHHPRRRSRTPCPARRTAGRHGDLFPRLGHRQPQHRAAPRHRTEHPAHQRRRVRQDGHGRFRPLPQPRRRTDRRHQLDRRHERSRIGTGLFGDQADAEHLHRRAGTAFPHGKLRHPLYGHPPGIRRHAAALRRRPLPDADAHGKGRGTHHARTAASPPSCGHRPPLRPHGLLLEADSGVALGAAEHTQGRLPRQGPAERFPRGFSSQGRKNHYICSAWHDSDIPPKGGF